MSNLTKVKRIYNEDMMIDSDTFKLKPANYSKNISFDSKNPLLIGVEHCHFYHTFDSSGKKMTQSNHVGGHTHDVIVKVEKDGSMTATCSGPIPPMYNDKHTHEVEYIKSDRFKVRKMNEQAAKLIAGLE